MDSLRLLLLPVFAAACSIVTLSCAAERGPAPQVETPPPAEATADGLVRIRNSGFANAWSRPGIAFSDYDSVTLAPLLVAYKQTPRPRSSTFGTDDNHLLDEGQLATFKRYFSDSFQGEFAKSEQYETVTVPRARTLVIAPAVVDLVVEVPADPTRVDLSFSRSAATMTLLLDVRDSTTGEVLARVAERRTASTPGAYGTTALYSNDPVNDAAALRATFGAWARRLRMHLDRLNELGPVGAIPEPPI